MATRRGAEARRVSLRSLVGALYFMVSGGPYGIEEIARAVGFGGAVIVLVVTPIFWCLPTLLMVGELAAALPEEGGYYAWVRRGLGPFWGYQEGFLSLTASAFDMALYPTLFVLYAERLWPGTAAAPVVLAAVVIAAAAACNLAGAQAVGQGSAAMTALLLAPFAAMTALAVVGHSAPTALASLRHSQPSDVAGAVMVAMWNYMGWDSASTIAAEVEAPQRTYPRAIVAAVGLIALTYIVPILAMWFAHVDPSAWDTGSWVDAGRTFGGPFLAVALVCGGMVSAFGMTNALCLSYSRLPAAMARDGYLPSVFARRGAKRGVPWVSVIACSLGWMLALRLSFDRLLFLDLLLYGISLALEFAALIRLRLREPLLVRPIRVPGGVFALALMAAMPLSLLTFALTQCVPRDTAGVSPLILAGGIILVGPLAYAITGGCGQRGSRSRAQNVTQTKPTATERDRA